MGKRVGDACKKGIKRYGVVLAIANSLQLDIPAAELHAQAFFGEQSALQEFQEARVERRGAKKVEMLSVNLGIDEMQAREVLGKARNGDQTAWQLIRQARTSVLSEPCA